MKANGKANGHAQKNGSDKPLAKQRKNKPKNSRKQKPKAKPRALRPNVTKIAKDHGVTRQTIYTWRDEGCPIDQGNAVIREWREQHHPIEPEKNHDYDRLLAAKARKEEARAFAEEQENLRRSGTTILYETAERGLCALVNLVRTRMDSWPEKAIEGVAIESRPAVLESLKNQVHLLLTELSQAQLEI